MTTLRKLIKEFGNVSKAYSSNALELKRASKKIVCYYGSRVPVEIIHASGAIPYPLFDGGDIEPIEAALPYLLVFANVQSLYQVGQHELGLNPIIPIADLIVVDCKETDSVRVGDVFEFKGLPVWKLGVPQDWLEEIALNYYGSGLRHLKEKLENLTDNNISNDNLVQSIKKYNHVRRLLSDIQLFRKKHPPVIGGENFIKLNHYALRSDPDTAIRYLENIRYALSGERSKFPDETPRIMVAGRGFGFGDYFLLKTIEDSGGV
ncbi:MAG: hypothetical protein DRG83_09925, partial [Deltaproteobacteria bacterium]